MAGHVVTWDPLDQLDDPYGRERYWNSYAPDDPGDLEAYARQRALAWTRDGNLAPFGCLFDHESGRNINTTRGVFPNGIYGVLGHRLRERKVSVGGQAEPGVTAPGTVHVREGHTFAAVSAPETKTTIVAMNARAAQLASDQHGAVPDALDNDFNWRLDLHERGDRELFDAVWRGPVGERVRAAYPWGEPDRIMRVPETGGRLDIRAGIFSLWAPGYIEDPAELDALFEMTGELASGVRRICAAATQGAPFAQELPAPRGWTEAGRGRDSLLKALDKAKTKRVTRGATEGAALDVVDGGAREDERWAGVRDFAHSYAAKRDLALEDGHAFDVAFPSLAFHGWTQFACRGTLPGGAPYRVAMSALRPFVWQPQFSHAGLIAVAEAPAGAPEAPATVQESTGFLTGVSGGLVWVARYVRGMDVDHSKLDGVAGALRARSA